MELNYPQKANGMYILRREQMDDIAHKLLQEYMPSVLERPAPVDIDALAEEGLFLTIKTKTLGLNNSILGLTAFEDVRGVPCCDEMFRPATVDLEAGTVLIHSWLGGLRNRARRRFTVAHECSHWVLHRSYHSPTNQKYTLRTQRFPYIACRSENIEKEHRGPRTDDEWEEWQADNLASALLMPLAPFRWEADRVIRKCGRRYLTDEVNHEYIECVGDIADIFRVSKTAAKIRLKQLGYIREAPYSSTRLYYS
jgi:hypothetical protein